MARRELLAGVASALLVGWGRDEASSEERDPADPLRHPRERRLRNIRQLTFGGQNAEA